MKEAPLKEVPDRRQNAPRRRSIRAELRVPVVVKWHSESGSPREEATETHVVNAHGCLLLLASPLLEGTRVELIHARSRETREGRVAWSGGPADGGKNRVAIELDDSDPKFWGQEYVDFLLWLTLRPH